MNADQAKALLRLLSELAQIIYLEQDMQNMISVNGQSPDSEMVEKP